MAPWNTAFPELLTKLHQLEFDYADGDGIDFEPYSSFLSADETSSWFKAWTGNKEVDGAEFRVFGQDGTGGYAAFWLVAPTEGILEQPIVFLGSEGQTGVVASDFAHYLWLLAGGIGPYEAVAYPGLARAPVPSFLSFAKIHSSCGPLQPNEVLTGADRAFPAFVQRVQSLCR